MTILKTLQEKKIKTKLKTLLRRMKESSAKKRMIIMTCTKVMLLMMTPILLLSIESSILRTFLPALSTPFTKCGLLQLEENLRVRLMS